MIKKTSSLAACVLLGLQLSPALATTFTLTDGNSQATVDSVSQAGMSNWTVDGTNYLQQQWFWFRSDQVPLASIDTLSLNQENHPNANELQVRYGTSSSFWIDISYELIGGPNGSGTATLNENIEIINNGNGNLIFDFFQYSDFNLSQGQDSVAITNGDTATQNGGQASTTEEVTSITPTSRVEANLSSNTKNSLNTVSTYDLKNFFSDTAGPGDVTSAFQWEGTIGQGGSFIITKTKTISAPFTNPIPEPSTLLLVGTGLLMAGLARLKHRP